MTQGLFKKRNMSRYVTYFVLTIITIIVIFPFLWVVLGSLKTGHEIMSSPFSFPSTLKWENYREAWTRGRFAIYMRNSIIIAIPVIIGSIAVSSLAGYAFARLNFWGSGFLLALFVFGLTIPIQSRIITLYFILRRLNLLNNLLGVIVVTIGGPFGIILMRAFFKQIPEEFRDAGKIDGCTEFGIFYHIFLPMARPALFSLIIFSFMATWNEFFLALVILTTNAKRTLPLGIVHFQDRFSTRYELMFAGLVISIIPIFIVYLLFQREFVRGIAAGGIKE